MLPDRGNQFRSPPSAFDGQVEIFFACSANSSVSRSIRAWSRASGVGVVGQLGYVGGHLGFELGLDLLELGLRPARLRAASVAGRQQDVPGADHAAVEHLRVLGEQVLQSRVGPLGDRSIFPSADRRSTWARSSSSVSISSESILA